MRISFKDKELKIWGIFSFVIVLICIIVVSMLYSSYISSKNTFLDLELKRFQGEVNSTLITYEGFSNYIFDEINKDEEVKNIIDQALFASDEGRDLLRKRLYNKLYVEYEIMQKYEFRQFHFHFPNTESFLRVHSPHKYGDLLHDSRESVVLANKTKKKISGFEEGKIFNGFRNVYPLSHNDKHLGTVEISMSSSSIIKVLSQLYEDKDFHFIIDKAVVEENLFNDEMGNYKDSNVFDDYYIDAEVYDTTLDYYTVLPHSKNLFFQGLKEKHRAQLENRESFATIYKFNGKYYTTEFLAIDNFKDVPVAYLISISESLGHEGFIRDMYKGIGLVSLLSILVIIFGLILTIYQYKLKNSAELDFLTNIYNRNKFYELANREIKNAKRNKKKMSLMLMDIDLFKNINDTHGHAWGDKVLKKLASKVSANIREVDIFARWGGEEFVLLLPNTSRENGLIVAEKIRKLICQSATKELKDVTISIGVAEVDSKGYDIDAAIKLADDAMYEAKRCGRNRVAFK